MNLELEKLIELQKTDSNIRNLKKAIETADTRRAGIEQEFEQHASSVRDVQNQHAAAKHDRAELEKQIAEQQTYLERANRNLKTAQDQKQYELAMRETEALQKQIGTLETQVLEKLNTIEELDKVLTERADEINGLEGNHKESIGNFENQLAADKEELTKTMLNREQVFSRISPNWASVYNRLVQRSRDGVAVAEVKNGACSACFMSLRKQVLQQLKTTGDIITCENCTRILYLSPAEAKSASQDS